MTCLQPDLCVLAECPWTNLAPCPRCAWMHEPMTAVENPTHLESRLPAWLLLNRGQSATPSLLQFATPHPGMLTTWPYLYLGTPVPRIRVQRVGVDRPSVLMRHIVLSSRIGVFEGGRSGPCLLPLTLVRESSKFATNPATVCEKGSLFIPRGTVGVSASYRAITFGGGRG